MRDWQSVQAVALRLPSWHVLIHQADKARIVRGFEQVDHFVDEDVLEALSRLLGQLGIETDAPRTRVATAPFGFHVSDEHAPHMHLHGPLPLHDERRNYFSNLAAIDLMTMNFKNAPPGTEFARANDINDAGQIAVDANLSDGGDHGFLLTPYNFNLSDPVPGSAGQVNTIQITGLQPGQKVRLAAGFKPGAQTLPNSTCLGGLLLIQTIRATLPPVTADSSGTATFVVDVPASASGQRLRFQAFDRDNCEISHSVDWVF